MKPSPVIVLSDVIRSGKTTALKEWAQRTTGIEGFLSPDVDGKRVFQELGSGRILPMEVENGDLQVGRFQFNQAAFKEVETAIMKAWKASEARYLILDEIGPLEIRKQLGFHQLLVDLQAQHSSHHPTLVLVVRASCLNEFLEHYRFDTIQTYDLEAFRQNFL